LRALGVSRRWTLGALLALVTMGCELPPAALAASARAQVAQAAPTREANPAPPTPAAVPTPATDDAGQWGNAGGLRYLELVRGGASLDDTLPLVIVLHGLGDRPRPIWFEGFLRRARFVLFQAPTPYGTGFSWFDYQVGENDQPALGRAILAAASPLAQAIAEIRRTRPTRGKTSVVGFSQGAMLSYALALYHPQDLGAVFPIAGALPPSVWPSRRAPNTESPPIFSVHGTLDPIVPFEADSLMTTALRTRGFDVELRPIPGARHEFNAAMDALIEARLMAAVDAAAASR